MTHDEGFDPNTTNRFVKLRLGSTVVTTPTTITSSSSDSEDRVIFSDPCSTCGTKKRRLSPHQESLFKPRKKQILIEPTSTTGGTTSLEGSDSFVRSIYGSIPFPNIPSSPISSSPMDSHQFCNSVPLSSPDQNNKVITQSQTSPPSFARSDSFPTPKSPANSGLIQIPASQPVVHRGRNNLFSGSSGNPQTPSEASPSNASLPPRPPTTLLRTVSDPTPDRSILTPSGQIVCDNRFMGSPDSTTGESPSERRWRRMRERLAEMNKWVESVIQEQDTGEIVEANNTSEILIKDTSEVLIEDVKKKEVCEIALEDNVTAERDGDNFRVSYKCCCGRRYQIVLSI